MLHFQVQLSWAVCPIVLRIYSIAELKNQASFKFCGI
jgi:hypothetical protein